MQSARERRSRCAQSGSDRRPRVKDAKGEALIFRRTGEYQRYVPRSVSGWVEIWIFSADPRGIAASEVFCVSLNLRVWIEGLGPLVISATKILILDIVVRQPAMDPPMLMPQMLKTCVPRENRRGKCGGKNGYHAHRSCHGHLISPHTRPPRTSNHSRRCIVIDTKTFFIFRPR